MNIRDEIKSQAGKVPIYVVQGSVQQAIRWKDRANEALRIANNAKSTQHQLEQALKSLK